ncbi:winged helix-turn-helix transcriptional regulator [Nonlabens sp. SY33080]|uniref:winged helix-turn-helix transcriptional regulator n=1 Tax=Nonlabens sp. SY33080 TaxID=2719911 RepID=UPI001982495A|nr:helix-turn-helix domain-containing protein [Nonlabens sp. SY33080]
MDVASKYLGGKWKTIVLWYLKDEEQRFADLKRVIPQISDRMLSITLKQLEDDGLIDKEVYTTKPPHKVGYLLSDFGKSSVPMLEAIAHWGRAVSKTRGKIVEV